MQRMVETDTPGKMADTKLCQNRYRGVESANKIKINEGSKQSAISFINELTNKRIAFIIFTH